MQYSDISNKFWYLFADGAPALFDAWFVGDNVMKEATSTLAAIKESAKKNNERLHIQEYYNVSTGYPLTSCGVKLAVTRMINSLIDLINQKHKLPRYLIVLMDRDIFTNMDVFSEYIIPMVHALVNWMVKQTDIIIRRKRAELLDRKPGGLFENHPTIIFVRMICRVTKFGDPQISKNQCSFDLQAKFNEALNDAVARYNHRILTINSCNTSSHLDLWDNLSNKGFRSLWYELDDLLECFDKNAVKLLPNPNKKRKPAYLHECPEEYFTKPAVEDSRVVVPRTDVYCFDTFP